MAGLVFPIGLVRLKSDFYVIVNPSLLEYPRQKETLSDGILDSKMSHICNDLWGVGTALKILKVSQGNFNLDEELEKFDRQIEIYNYSCKLQSENNELDLHDIGEEKMLQMGLPLVYGFEQKTFFDDCSFIMTISQFTDEFMPRVNKKYPVGFTSFCTLNKKDVIIEVSKAIVAK